MRRPWIFVMFAAFLVCTLVRLISSEMFLDGVTYAGVARNLAVGNGSFWHAAYVPDFSPFWDQPPVGFWLESLAFRLLGDSANVEVVWGLALGALSLFLVSGLAAAARGACPDSGRCPAGWAGTLALLAPLLSWCFTNNMLENTLLVFVLGASWAALVALRAPVACAPGPLALAALLTGLAVLTKGPPALFVLGVPFWSFLFLRTGSLGRACAHVVLLGLGAAAVVGLVTAGGGAEAADFWRTYISIHVLGGLGGQFEIAPSPLFLTKELIRQLAFPLSVCLGLHLLAAPAENRPPASWKFHLAIALSASLPFLVLRKQMSWYLMPSLAFFALALADRFEAAGAAAQRWLIATAWRRALAMAATLGTIVVSIAVAAVFRGALDTTIDIAVRDAWRSKIRGETIDDRYSEYCWGNFRRDILSQGPLLPPGEQVTNRTQGCYWRAIAYFERHARIALSRETFSRILLERYPEANQSIPANCVPLQPRPARRFMLYECDLQPVNSQVFSQ